MKKLKLGGYLPGDSLIHRLDPRTKLLGGLAIIITILAVNSWPVFVLNTVLIFLVVYLEKIDFKAVLQGVKWMWMIILLSFTFQCIFVKGTPLVVIGRLIITREGLYLGVLTFLRLLILYLSSTILTMTTSPLKLASGLEALFSPLRYLKVPVNQLAMLISISLRFIPTIIEEAEIITKAQKSRGAPFSSAKKLVRLQTGMAVFIPLIVGSLQRATDLATAMESRCYTGGSNCSRLKKLNFGRTDLMALALIAASCILPLFCFHGRFWQVPR
jgi:energy-coupling factor transport system permease protein